VFKRLRSAADLELLLGELIRADDDLVFDRLGRLLEVSGLSGDHEPLPDFRRPLQTRQQLGVGKLRGHRQHDSGQVTENDVRLLKLKPYPLRQFCCLNRSIHFNI